MRILPTVALALLLAAPAFAAPAFAAPKVEYRVVIVTTTQVEIKGERKADALREESAKKLEDASNAAAKDGWKLTATSVVPLLPAGSTVTHYLYFERTTE